MNRLVVVFCFCVFTALFTTDADARPSSKVYRGHSISRDVNKRPFPKRKVKNVWLNHKQTPASAKHVDDAKINGHARILTVDRRPGYASARRTDSLKAIKPRNGYDRDEYPPAISKEGGKGASVRHIPPSDNRSAGACVGAQCRDLRNGEKFRIVTRKNE